MAGTHSILATSLINQAQIRRAAEQAVATDRFAPKTPAIFDIQLTLAAAERQTVGRQSYSHSQLIAVISSPGGKSLLNAQSLPFPDLLFMLPMSDRYTLSFECLLFGVPLGILAGITNGLFLNGFVFPFLGVSFDGQVTTLLTLLWSGIVAGAVQGLFIHPRPRPAAVWIAASTVGWLAIYAVMLYYEATQIFSIGTELLLGIPVAFFAGFAQWLYLQRYLNTAYWWFVSTVCFWTILWAGGVLSLYALSGPHL